MSVIRKPARSMPLDLALLQREMNQLLERLADFDRGERAAEADWVPPVDVYECRGRLTVVVEVPGLTADSLRVAVKDRRLVITGERRERRPPAGQASFLCMERPQGRFTRALLLDVPVDVQDAEAHVSAGVLTVVLPRLKDRRGRETVIPVHRDDEP
jgi:HSP20 family protein